MATSKRTAERPFTNKQVAGLMRSIADAVIKTDEMAKKDPTTVAVLSAIMQNLALLNQHLSFIGSQLSELVITFHDANAVFDKRPRATSSKDGDVPG